MLKIGVDIDLHHLENELIAMVRDKIGAVACFRKASIVKRLPKTRSGKILRKIMRCMADGTAFSPPSTIEDISVLDELSELMKKEKIGIGNI